MKLLVIDHHDSFVHNLARYAALAGFEPEIFRNDAIDIDAIKKLAPQAILLSPGPKTPQNTGITNPLIKSFHASVPILGICLGHQCIAATFDATVSASGMPMHGRASTLTHDNRALFRNISQHSKIGRYHSLNISLKENTPLIATAHSNDGVIMSVSHESSPCHGLQFHPESILTEHGHRYLENFKTICDHWYRTGETL